MDRSSAARCSSAAAGPSPSSPSTGQGLSEHTTPFDAVAHLLEGEAEITIAGKAVTVAAGQMVLLPAGQPHALRAIIRFKMLLTMIRSA
jgi:quercetin dioxygenase-like cupin family protein